jgi:ribosomal protein S18 acetylase RimI-like enzyme
MITFRALDPSRDYERMAEIINLTALEPISAQIIEERNRARPKDAFLFREAAIDASDTLIGWCRVERHSTDPTGYYHVGVDVHPEARGQGVGGALFDRAVASFQDTVPKKIIVYVRDNEPFSQHFAEKRGFQIERQQFDSRLELQAFDETPFIGVIEAVEATGIRFSNLALEGDTETNRRKLYELNKISALDIPGFEGEFETFEQFSKYVFEASWFDLEGQILAIYGSEYVALGAVGFSRITKAVFNAFTGVHPKYRGRHLALAVKLLGIRFAKTRGADYFRTGNDSKNAPMLHINRDKLGFIAEPGWYKMVLEV